MNWLHALLHVIAADTSNSRWYFFWSAFGSGPLAWCVLPLVYLRHHNCHTRWCWRMGHSDQNGTVWCRKHNKEKGSQMTSVIHSAQGRDVSDFQPVQTVASWDGYDFGFAKATEGTGWTGKTFAPNYANMAACAKSRAFARGAYHFLHPGEDPIAQAQHFYAVVKTAGIKPGDMLVVDSELMSSAPATSDEVDHQMRRISVAPSKADIAATASQVDACTLAFCDEVRRLVGPYHPIICYTMHEVGVHLTQTAAKYPLFFAWPSTIAPPAGMIAPWKAWLFWQFSWAGGNRGDLDAFNGTAADLHAWVAKFLPPTYVKRYRLLTVTANGTESLSDVAKRYGTTAAWIIAWTFRNIPMTHNWAFGRYVLAAHWSAPLRKGTMLAVWAWVEVPAS